MTTTIAEYYPHNRHFSPESDAYSISGLSPQLYRNNADDSDASDSGVHSSPLTESQTERSTQITATTADYEDLLILREKMRLRGQNLSKTDEEEQEQLSMLALVIAALRRSLLTCKTSEEEAASMEISWPTDVRHVTHVTFDRFNGFLGLPVEFEIEIPRRVPSASASVFGVSAESMQCSFDAKGNSVPTILLLMQERLYSQGGLKAEGIFRINAENSHEEDVREQLNRGVVPSGMDVHCLAGLIKAWFRELPKGVLDSLTPEEVLQCNSEEECVELVKQLPVTQSALLDWAVNLMADVAQEEASNKMNARNIAMVFAPNMTQMTDPLTALMHAVQVMNLLKSLVVKTLRDRHESLCTDAHDDEHHHAHHHHEHHDDDDDDDDDGHENGVVVVETSLQCHRHRHRHHHRHHHHHHHRRSHSRKSKSDINKLVNRIDQQSERAEAW